MLVFVAKTMGKHPLSTVTSVLRWIHEQPPGWVFTPSDFVELGSRTAVATALKRHSATGAIRQLGRGLYDVPRRHPLLGLLWPSAEEITRALQRKDRVRLQPAGAYAANLLGLSEQVPAKIIFLTDGPTREIVAGPLTISLRRTTTRNMATAGRLSGLLIQAFRYLGQQHITQERLERLRKTLPVEERRKLLQDLLLAPSWMRPHLQTLARP